MPSDPNVTVDVALDTGAFADIDAAFREWQAARRALTDAALPLARLTATHLDLSALDRRGQWRDGHQDDQIRDDLEVLQAYNDAVARCRRALDRFHELTGIGSHAS